MNVLIATVALLGFVAATQAHDPRFSALATFAAGAHKAPVDATPGPDHEPRGDIEGFSGSFSARQTARNLGY